MYKKHYLDRTEQDFIHSRQHFSLLFFTGQDDWMQVGSSYLRMENKEKGLHFLHML